MAERLIPRLRLSNYRIVDREGKTLIATEELITFFEELAEKKEMAYILDLNGFREGTPHLDLISEISDILTLWVEANSKSVEDVSDILVAGAERVVLDIEGLTREEFLKILEETTNIAIILKNNLPFSDFRLNQVPFVLRSDRIGFEGVNPVVLDVEGLGEERRGKLNIIGRIVELDLNEL